MRKSLLLVFLTLFAISLSAADLNPFAYNLYTSTNADVGTRLHFSINATAPRVEVYIVVGGADKLLRTYTNVVKNSYYTDITASDASSLGISAGSSYSWKVKVTTPDRSSSAEYVGRKVDNMPVFSMDIDNNPTSPYFGRILISHGTNNISGEHGIHVYKADFTKVGGRNLGTGISLSSDGWYGYNHLTPYRIRIAQDGSGRIFLANYDVSQSAYLWQVDPANLKSWTQLISRSWMKNNVGKNVDDITNTLDVYNFGLDVRTNDNQYQLLLLSGNSGGGSLITGSVFSGIYTIPNINSPTTSTSYTQLKWKTQTGEESIRNLFGSAINSSAIFDKNGNVWYCGNSSSGTQTSYPGVAHQMANSTDYKINYDNSITYLQKQYTASGGIRYDKNYNRIAIAQGDGNRKNIAASIWTVNHGDGTTHPTLSSRVDLDAGAVKGSTEWYITDIAWDYADNVYLCVRNTSATIRGIYAFATDLGARVLDVDARNSFQLQLPSGVKEGTTGLNPYAYDVRAQFDESTHKLIVNFSLNDDAYNDGTGGNADGVQIYLTDDPANPKKYYVYGVPANQCFKGKDKTCTIDLISGKDKNGEEIPRNKDLYVSVTVQGDRTNTKPRQISTLYKLSYSHGVAINKNPYSKYFGKIFVTEAKPGTTQDASFPQTKGLPGLYVMDPDFGFTSTTRYTGGYDFSSNAMAGIERVGYEPWRVRISAEGRVFVCSNDVHQGDANNGVAVWEVDTTNFNEWKPILKGARNSEYTFKYQGYDIGLICGMDVKGVGDALTLLLYTTNKYGAQYNDTYYKAYEYNVKSGVMTPIAAFNNDRNFGIVHNACSMVYGVDGSYWFGASRSGNPTAIQRNLAHAKDKTSTAPDYDNYNGEFNGGGGLIVYKSSYPNETYNNTNHTWLIKGKHNQAINSNNGYFDVFLVTSASDGGASVARMSGTSGRPDWQMIEVTGIQQWLNDFAIDYAENLYVVGSDGKMIRAFAMPYCGEKTTPALNQAAREQYKFQLKGQPVTWHAYHCPETMINEDLWELFMEDYNEYYKTILPEARAVQPITNAIGFTYPPEEIRGTYPNGVVLSFLQNHPQWKWLHNYINTVVENDAVTSNEALWAAFKTDADITSLGTLAEISVKGEGQPHDVAATPCACRIIAGQLTNVKMRTIYANDSWKWLFDYIKTIQTGLSTDLTEDAKAQAWRYAVAAFFLQSQHPTFPATDDFSTAGLPTAWGPKATAAGKTYAFSLTGELTWRLHVHAFFNKTNSITHEAKIYTTADFSEAGDPHAWYNTWADVTFPKVLRTGDKMPKIKRKGYIFAGWHYGTEQGFTRDQKVADDQYNEGVTNNKHIWARWMELCLYEGYNKPDPHFLGEPAKVNYNEELMNRAAGASYNIDIERNLSPGMYNTITLPFAIPSPRADFLKKVTDENGAHVFDPEQGGVIPSIYVYDGTEEVEVEVGEETVLQFNFHELGEEEVLLANTPFLIKTNNPEKLSGRLHFWSAYISSAQHAAVSPNQVAFVPVLGPGNITIPNGSTMLILVADNRLAKVTSSGEMLGLRGYFSMPESMKSMPAQICIKENASTDTEEVEVDSGNSAYKILENQRVYIIRGKEVYTTMGDCVR